MPSDRDVGWGPLLLWTICLTPLPHVLTLPYSESDCGFSCTLICPSESTRGQASILCRCCVSSAFWSK